MKADMEAKAKAAAEAKAKAKSDTCIVVDEDSMNNKRSKATRKPVTRWPNPWPSDSDSDDCIVYGGPV